MQKIAIMIITVILIFFAALEIYDRYQIYQATIQLQKWTNSLSKSIEEAEAKIPHRTVNLNPVRKKPIYRQSAPTPIYSKTNVNKYSPVICAINERKNSCMCVNKTTGTRVSFSKNKCMKRAREITR